MSFDSIVHFQRYSTKQLFIAKIISVNTIDRITILALCAFADGPLSKYQVSFNSLVYFQRHAPDKVFIAKMKRGSNSVNTVDRLMVLALCNCPHAPLSVYQVSFKHL